MRGSDLRDPEVRLRDLDVGEEVTNRMLLRAYTGAKVAWGDFRVGLHDRLVEWAGSERGGVAAEYALLIALIAVVIVVGASALGVAINARLNTTAGCVTTAPATC